MNQMSENAPGLSDAEYIELLWKCVYLGGDLMPADMPHTEALMEWSGMQEAATVERQRRELEAIPPANEV